MKGGSGGSSSRSMKSGKSDRSSSKASLGSSSSLPTIYPPLPLPYSNDDDDDDDDDIVCRKLTNNNNEDGISSSSGIKIHADAANEEEIMMPNHVGQSFVSSTSSLNGVVAPSATINQETINNDFHQSLANNDDNVPLGGRRDERLMSKRDVKKKPIVEDMRTFTFDSSSNDPHNRSSAHDLESWIPNDASVPANNNKTVEGSVLNNKSEKRTSVINLRRISIIRSWRNASSARHIIQNLRNDDFDMNDVWEWLFPLRLRRWYRKRVLPFWKITLAQIICVIYILVLTFSYPPVGMRDPNTGDIVDSNSVENTDNGVIDINGNYRPVVAEGGWQKFCLAMSRMSAFSMYPMLIIVFITKMKSLQTFFIKTPLSIYIDMINDGHSFHKYAGKYIAFDVWIHTIFHVLRFASQGNINLLWTTRTGISGLITVIATPLITLPMMYWKRHISYESRKALHYLFYLLGKSYACDSSWWPLDSKK